jgi:hypothetical protein
MNALHPTSLRIVALLLIAMLATPPLRAQLLERGPGDENWQGGIVDLDASTVWITSAAAIGDDLYVGGLFSAVDGTPANGIARWDGSRWRAVGAGIDGGIPVVIAGEGSDLYVGGIISSINRRIANDIAHWDGTQWRTMGESGVGVDGNVSSIVADGDRVFVGGNFRGAAYDIFADTSMPARSVAVWNRTTNRWSPLADGAAVGVNGSVSAMARDGDFLYVVGMFDTAGVERAAKVAAYDLAQRQWLGIGDVDSLVVDGVDRARVYSVAARDGRVAIAGSFGRVAGVDVTGAALYERSNGAWRALVTDTAIQSVDDLAWHEGRLVGVGRLRATDGPRNLLLRWNESLTAYEVDTLDERTTAIAAGEDLYALGTWDDRSRVTIMKREGTAWSPIPSDFMGWASRTINRVLAAGDDIYVGGYFDNVGDTRASNIARWHRPTRTWHALGVDTLEGVNAMAHAMLMVGDDLYVGGDFDSAGGAPANKVAVWSRATNQWRALPAIDGNGVNGAVRSIIRRGETVLFGGNIDSAGSLPALGLAYWSSDENLLLPYELGLPTLVTAVRVSSLLVRDDTLYLGGYVEYGGFGGGSGVAKSVDGETVLITPDGVNGSVYDLAMIGDDLYMAGSFSEVEGVTVNGVARWNGLEWSALGSGDAVGVNGWITSMIAHAGRIFVGGSFDKVGDIEASRIASWDGTAWTPLGSGTNESVTAMTPDGDGVLVGGDFTIAGGKVAVQIARWSTAPSGVAIEPIARASMTPHPVADVARLGVTLERSATVELVIVDALGRVVARVAPQTRDAGAQHVVIDARTLAPALYIARVTIDGATTSVPFIVDR